MTNDHRPVGRVNQMLGQIMIDLLTIVQRHYPEERDKIKQRFDEDSTLQEIAENYRDCISALHHWRRLKAPEAQARVIEYSTFSRELEQEALNTYQACIKQLKT